MDDQNIEEANNPMNSAPQQWTLTIKIGEEMIANTQQSIKWDIGDAIIDLPMNQRLQRYNTTSASQ